VKARELQDRLSSEENNSKLGDLSVEKNEDLIKDYCRVEQLRDGSILDAQDYLGTWHMAIVLETKQGNGGMEKKLHFLPFFNSKRDEWFTEANSDQITPVFTNTEMGPMPDKSF
jgi:hypothetical protein